MKLTLKSRILKLQEELRKNQIDVAMIYDRENLIYFANVDDLEGGCMIIPSSGEAKLICLSFEGKYIKEKSGIDNVITYNFPNENISEISAMEISKLNIKNIKIGFTRYFISLKDYQMLRKYIPEMVVGDISEICYKIRAIKDDSEIEKIMQASKYVAIGMDAAKKALKPNMKEVELLAEADYAMKKAGSQGSSFRMQVLTQDRQMLVHPYAGENIIRDNETVVVHLGASYKGYTAKMCRTFFLGEIEREKIDIYNILKEAQKKAIEYITPGVTSSEIYDLVYDYLKEKGYAKWFIVDHLGYGVGIRQSEFYPIIGKDINHVIKENMVIDLLLPTIFKYKIGGSRITDTILIKKDGCVNLTQKYYDKIYNL